MTDPPPDLLLASASPRRRELLDQIGVRYAVQPVDVDEQARDGEAPGEYVRRLALAKAEAGRAQRPDLPALGADTAVVLDGHILGKPADRADGLAMLTRLSGRRHEVYSGVALVGEETRTMLQVSRVTLRAIGEGERAAYWDTGEPADKAGGYAIQGLGAVFVAELAGSYSGVMGLPLFETARMLTAAGIDVL